MYDLPRKVEEARINDYNPLLLYLWKANVDVQYIAETSMALTGYITAYVTKAEKSAMQSNFEDLSSTGTLYGKMWKFAKECLKNRESGTYEVGDNLRGDPLNEKSHTVQYAKLPTKRNRKLKTYAELKRMKPNSTDMFTPSLIDVHYPNRPDRLSSMCLHDFVAHIDWYDRDGAGEKTYRRLVKPRVIRHPKYKTSQKEQEQAYYYGLLLLFVPYTDESDLLEDGETPKTSFERRQNKGLLNHHAKLQKMLECNRRMREISDARKRKRLDPPKKEDEKKDDDDDEDVLLQGMAKSHLDRHLELDLDVDPVTLDKRLSMLNEDQCRVYEKISSHLLHKRDHEKGACKCSNLKPLQMFVSGVGGTGKSFLIQALRAFVKDTWPDLANASAVAAPTGLAACNVNGVTTYQLFQLPIEHDSKTALYWELPKETLKYLRQQLKNVKVFIIDEVSMVSSLNLTYIHLRLDEIYGGNEWFGARTMLFVGDILQLPPVTGAPVFQNIPSKILSLRIGCIGSTNIWKSTVVYDELTINERQKGDKLYTDMLDGVRRGFPSKQAISLLTQRVFDVPVLEKYEQLIREGKKPICLFSTRKACAEVNSDLLKTLDSEVIKIAL